MEKKKQKSFSPPQRGLKLATMEVWGGWVTDMKTKKKEKNGYY